MVATLIIHDDVLSGLKIICLTAQLAPILPSALAPCALHSPPRCLRRVAGRHSTALTRSAVPILSSALAPCAAGSAPRCLSGRRAQVSPPRRGYLTPPAPARWTWTGLSVIISALS